MQRVVILILILALAGGAYFLFKGDGVEPAAPDLKSDGDASIEDDVPDEPGPGLERKKAAAAMPAPDPASRQLQVAARALLLAKHKDSWNHSVLMVYAGLKQLSYGSWFTDVKEGDAHAGQARGLEVADLPTAAFLTDNDISVLVLDKVDPNALPKAFWETVRDRVEGGRMGLFVRPGFPSDDGKGKTEHAMLTHPVLKDLLPVMKAAPLSGTPIPGLFTKPQTLIATREGNRHPATQLIAVPEVSVKAWGDATMGDGAFATQFCYPVLEVKDGFQVLVNCEAASTLPAVIATPSDAKARVFWMGNVDFGVRTYYVRAKDKVQRILVNHATIWLAGQAQP